MQNAGGTSDMSFETREISNQDGLRIALYEIEWGNTKWYYTSADQDIPLTIGDEDRVYKAIAISDSGMQQGGGSNQDITVEVPSNIPLCDLFVSTPPALEIFLTIRRVHYGDDGTPLIYWTGTINNVKRQEGGAGADVIGHTLLASFKRSGLRLSWTRGCPHMLYDQECRVNKADFAVNGSITALTGNSITVSYTGTTPEAGYFDGGFLEWEANDDGTIDRRSISSSTSETVLIIYGTTYRLEIGMDIVLYPGCNLSTAHCLGRFNNLANYGGLEQMTGKNPFDGTALV